MENSAYVSPPPLPPQAHLSSAAAAFQAACNNSTAGMNFQEALLSRMGRGHFGLTGSDMKDHFAGLGLAAAAASGRVGHGAGLEGFPAGLPLLSHMQPPFGLHPFDPRLPFSSAGAFRPLFGNSAAAAAAAAAAVAVSVANSNNDSNNSSLIHKSFPSAFQPPTSLHQHHNKSGKGSPPTLFSPGQNLYPRSSAGSPGSPSSSPPMSHRGSGKMDENSNTDRHADSVSPASMDSHDEERASKKIRLCGSKELGCCCPICGMPLRTSDLEAHYTQELEYLAKLSAALLVSQEQKNHRMKSPSASPGGKSQHSPGIGSIEIAPRSRWDTFQRIQRNRQSRIRVKLSRRAGKRPDEILEDDEPVHHRHDHLRHLQQQQLQQHGGPQSASTPAPHHLSNNADDEDIDIVGDDPTNNNNNRNMSLSSSDASRELQLHVYGPPQFSEADVLSCISQIEEEEEESRRRESEGFIKTEARSPDNDRMKEESEDIAEDGEEGAEGRRQEMEDVEALKAKLKQLEGSTKCSKCVRTLKNPVVNVGCWHVQCERCWLTSLGTKKCCSLCGMTTVPSDLRKVYL